MKFMICLQFTLTMLMLASAFIAIKNEAKFTDPDKKQGVLVLLAVSAFNIVIISLGYLLSLN